MSVQLIISAIFSIFIVIGHFTVGRKLYLVPTLEASFDEVAKKIMHSLFHYSSVFLVLSALTLSYFSLASNQIPGYEYLVVFIGFHFILNAIVQLSIAITSGIEKPYTKLFQWILFFITGCLAISSII